MNESIPDDLKDLIDEYLSGLADEARVAELDRRLCADPAARRYFVRYARMHTDLHLDARARAVGARALRALEPMQTPKLLFSPQVGVLPRLLVAAAALLFAVALGWRLTRPAGDVGISPPFPPEVAWLVNAQNCQWADDTAFADGLRAGTVLRIERGLAEFRFLNGAQVVIEGPANFELLNINSLRLEHGKLSAKIPESAKGFMVYSPQGRVIDLGTEFGVAVGNDGSTDVYVFKGKVEASTGPGAPVDVTDRQTARIVDGTVTIKPGDDTAQFVRAIVPPPVILPRTLTLDFRAPRPGTMPDSTGAGTGMTHRLPGTGKRLHERDANLRLDADHGRLELTTTDSDINRQEKIDQGEYFGVRLSDLGFTGPEDFAVTVTIPDIPALEFIGQFGLYAGTRSDQNIRGGVISQREPGTYRQFFVNNNGGRDTDSHFVGLFSTGDDLRLTLQRVGGKFSLKVENQTTKNSSTLNIRHPDFLDGAKDLYVGLFGANTRSAVRKTLMIQDFKATVWTTEPSRKAAR